MKTVDGRVSKPADVFLLVHGERLPTNVDWDATMKEWEEYARRKNAVNQLPRCLVLSRSGAGPNAKQRKIMDALNGQLRPRVAVATGSMFGRGIVTAISWFGHTQIKAYLPTDISSALEFLDVDLAHRASVQSDLDAFEKSLSTSSIAS